MEGNASVLQRREVPTGNTVLQLTVRMMEKEGFGQTVYTS